MNNIVRHYFNLVEFEKKTEVEGKGEITSTLQFLYNGDYPRLQLIMDKDNKEADWKTNVINAPFTASHMGILAEYINLASNSEDGFVRTMVCKNHPWDFENKTWKKDEIEIVANVHIGKDNGFVWIKVDSPDNKGVKFRFGVDNKYASVVDEKDNNVLKETSVLDAKRVCTNLHFLIGYFSSKISIRKVKEKELRG